MFVWLVKMYWYILGVVAWLVKMYWYISGVFLWLVKMYWYILSGLNGMSHF